MSNNIDSNHIPTSSPKASDKPKSIKMVSDKYLDHINKILSNKEKSSLKNFRDAIQFIEKNHKFLKNKIVLMDSIKNKLISFYTILSPIDLSWKGSKHYLKKLYNIEIPSEFDAFKQYKWSMSIEAKFNPLHNQQFKDSEQLEEVLNDSEILDYISPEFKKSYSKFFEYRSNLFFIPTFIYKPTNSWTDIGYSSEGYNLLEVHYGEMNLRAKDIISTFNLMITDLLITIRKTNGLDKLTLGQFSDHLVLGKTDEDLQPDFNNFSTVPVHSIGVENIGTYNMKISLPLKKTDTYQNKIINNKKYLKAINNLHILEPLLIALYTSVNPLALGRLNMVKNAYSINKKFDQKIINKDEPDTIKNLTNTIMKNNKISNLFRYNKFANKSNIIESLSVDFPFFINPLYLTDFVKIILLIVTNTCNFDTDINNPIENSSWVDTEISALMYGSIIKINYNYIELIEKNLCIKLDLSKDKEIYSVDVLDAIVKKLFEKCLADNNHPYWKFLWDDRKKPEITNYNQKSWDFNFENNIHISKVLDEVQQIVKNKNRIFVEDLEKELKQYSEWTNDSFRILEYLVNNIKLKKISSEKKVYYTL